MESKKVISNQNELALHLIPILDNIGVESISNIKFENLYLKFRVLFPFSHEINNVLKEFLYKGFDTYAVEFVNCEFNEPFVLDSLPASLTFRNVKFQRDVFLYQTDANITFENSFFNNKLILENGVFEGKVRFRACFFNGYTNFNNASFNNLADFFGCIFYQPTTFYKTDFNSIVVFSSAIFKENVLFTYALINKLMILRGTYPEKGFDLSLAIISGNLSLFDFQFDDYSSYGKLYKDADNELKKYNHKISYSEAYNIVYDKAVSINHQIPIENKRETYRILKNQLESQKNFIDAIPFKVMESKTHLKESWKKFKSVHHTFTRPLSNMIVLSLNGLSSWFGSSYIMGVVFTLLIGLLFFNGMLSHIGHYSYTTNCNEWQWEYFVKFINPTHRFDFMKSVDDNPEKWFYIYDFLGRIFIGYGIYQTVQAFRKYK